VPLPSFEADPPREPWFTDPVQIELMTAYRIEVPIVLWPTWPSRIVRTASQLYNHPSESEYLAEALRERIAR
jgi:hypothetical protein